MGTSKVERNFLQWILISLFWSQVWSILYQLSWKVSFSKLFALLLICELWHSILCMGSTNIFDSAKGSDCYHVLLLSLLCSIFLALVVHKAVFFFGFTRMWHLIDVGYKSSANKTCWIWFRLSWLYQKKGVKFNQFSRQEEGKKEWTVVFGSQ